MIYRLKTWYERVNGYTDDTDYIYIYEIGRNVIYDCIVLEETQSTPYTYDLETLSIKEWTEYEKDFQSIKEIKCQSIIEKVFND